MALSWQHPEFMARFEEWTRCRDCYAGEYAIKAKNTLYLPATSGQIADGMEPTQRGWDAYQAYKLRAVFPDFFEIAVESICGILHKHEAVIKLPPAMEPLRERATPEGESLIQVLRRINEAQLVTGRVGVLADLPSNPTDGTVTPYLCLYDAERVINWDNGSVDNPTPQVLNLVVIDESENERTSDFAWQRIMKYRVLMLGTVDLNESVGVYQQGLFRQTTDFDAQAMQTPSIRGNVMTEIPFVFINATDLTCQTGKAPLRKLADLSLTIYRGEADYRLGLFQQSQETLLLIGETEPNDQVRIGAGAKISVPIGGDGKFIGVSGAGLAEQRQALENDRSTAVAMGAQLLDTTSRQKESGEALKIRVAAQTATLMRVAQVGAMGLQEILRKVAVWMGANPAEVEVIPNTEFGDEGLTTGDLVNLASAKANGLPLSDEAIHQLLVENEFTPFDFTEEQTKIADEQGIPPADPVTGM